MLRQSVNDEDHGVPDEGMVMAKTENSSSPRKSNSFFNYLYSNWHTIGRGSAGLNFFERMVHRDLDFEL